MESSIGSSSRSRCLRVTHRFRVVARQLIENQTYSSRAFLLKKQSSLFIARSPQIHLDPIAKPEYLASTSHHVRKGTVSKKNSGACRSHGGVQFIFFVGGSEN